MDSKTFDGIARGLSSGLTRRRFGLATGGMAASLPGLMRPAESAARKRRRKKCRKGQKRCGNKCVKGTCCPGKPCGGVDCACIKATDGKTFCVDLALEAICQQCPVEGCGPAARCTPTSACGAGITGACRGVCPT